jgi:alkylation response protein AidB-like acyl-CoA dehydrogenase
MSGVAPGAATADPSTPVAYRAAEDLERFLGHPSDPDGRIGVRQVMEADEREALPRAAVEAAREWGFPAFLVPECFGGRLRSLEELVAVCRSLSRRDITVAVAYGTTMLGANPVWIWGAPGQQRWLAEQLLDGRLGSFAMSEEAHGSDLLACELAAERHGDGFLLSGSKWPIGNPNRGAFVTVFAKTGPVPGPRAFSLLLLDKQQLPTDRWSLRPRTRTLGVRGHDLGGISFDRCPAPASALIGREGMGVEQTLKALQITRTLIAALSLGGADTALRIALEYALHRRLYGERVYAIPVVRDQLLKAYLDLLICECLALPVSRALTLAPDRMSLWSSVVKYTVPLTVEELMAGMAVVLGARHYLREGVADGLFQKLQRDHAIASVFEGTTHVNLHIIASQLPAVLAATAEEDTARQAEALLGGLFSRVDEAPSWLPGQAALQLTNRGRDEISQAWPLAVARLEALGRRPDATAVQRALLAVVERIEVERAAYHQAAGELLSAGQLLHASVEGFALARRHCLFHAMAACLYTWLHNQERVGGMLANGEWLLLCLQRLLQRLHPDQELSAEHLPAVEREMLRCLDEHRLFSLVPLGLARPSDAL